MPTKSLFTDLIIDTPEALANYIRAFEVREEMGPSDTSKAIEITEDLEEIKKVLGLD